MASLNIISEEFTDQTLVARNRIENFISGSQLIVHESQEAIFFKNGQAVDRIVGVASKTDIAAKLNGLL